METLVCADIHGHYEKAKAFLEYRKNEDIQKVILGDIFDSYHATDETIIKTFELIMNSNCLLTVGNHELPYLRNAHNYFRCTGNRNNSTFVNLMETYKDRFKACYCIDNYLLVHGGVTKEFGSNFDTIEQCCEWCNNEFDYYKNLPIVPEQLSMIFDIGECRGGYQQHSGIFWTTYGLEKFDERFNIVCGHTHSLDARRKYNDNTEHVCVDNTLFTCFNTTTQKFEDFMYDEIKNNGKVRIKLEVIF